MIQKHKKKNNLNFNKILFGLRSKQVLSLILFIFTFQKRFWKKINFYFIFFYFKLIFFWYFYIILIC